MGSRKINFDCWGCMDKSGYTPNEDRTYCQCVMCHSCKKDGSIPQCVALRSEESNLFCIQCEQLHGDYYRAQYGGSE